MKRYTNIFKDICSLDNIIKAIYNASKGKHNRRSVAHVLSDVERYARNIKYLLESGTYKPRPYRKFKIKDGANKKEREIFCPAFYPDQIVHWALMQQIEPYIMKSLYVFTCGSIPGRGVHYGKKYLRKWLDTDRKNTKYCLKLDIKKFYPSINTENLKIAFRNKFKDKGTLWLINSIIDSHHDGVPIGNYTSQWFANFFLQGLDHYIKQNLKIKYYMRYMDDMVLLGRNKKELHKARKAITEYLQPLGLVLKGNWQVFRVDKRDIDFLGFRFFRNKTILRRRNALRIRRRVKKVSKKPFINYHDAAAIISYLGWLTHSDSHGYYMRYIKPYINIKKLKEIIRNGTRKQYTTGCSV